MADDAPMSDPLRPGAILSTGQRLIKDAVAQMPPGKRRAFVVLYDEKHQTIAAEYVQRVGDTWEFSIGFRKEWEKKPTARFVVQAAW